jgi:thiol:disulfide interchange protein DsbD
MLRRRVVWGISLAVVALSYALLLQPVLAQQQALSAEVVTEQDALQWIDFSSTEVERRVNGGQTVFIDFTAEWCWTCKVNERLILTQDAVRNKFAANNVALIKADWTNPNPEIARLLRAFGRSGVPLYVIFAGGHIDKPLVLPEIITADLVLQKLDEAEALRIGR